MRLSPRAVGLGADVVTILVWTSFIVISRASTQRALSTFDITAARLAGAAVVLLPWGWWLVRRRGLPGSLGLSPLPLRLTVLLGLFGGLLFGILPYLGFRFAPAVHGAVLMTGSLPLWTTLLAALLLHERITPARATGLGLIVAGGLLVGGASLLRADGGAAWKGDLLFLAASASWATYGVLVRRHGVDAVQATIAVIVFASLTYLPVYALLLAAGALPTGWGHVGAGEWLFQMLFHGVCSVVVSGTAFNLMVRHYGPVRTTMLTALVPGLSALGAVLWLGEPLHWNLLAGLALVTLGIVVGVRAAGLPRPAAAVAAAG